MQQTLAMIYTGLDRLGPQPAALMLSYLLLEHFIRKFNLLHLLCLHDSIDFFVGVSAHAVLSDLSISSQVKIKKNAQFFKVVWFKHTLVVYF